MFFTCDTYYHPLNGRVLTAFRNLWNDKQTGMHMAIAISCCMEHLQCICASVLLLLMYLSSPPGDVALMLLRALNGDIIGSWRLHKRQLHGDM